MMTESNPSKHPAVFSGKLKEYTNEQYGETPAIRIWIKSADFIQDTFTGVLDHPCMTAKFLPEIKTYEERNFADPKDFVNMIWDAIDNSFEDELTIGIMRTYIRAFIQVFTIHPPTILKAEQYLTTKFSSLDRDIIIPEPIVLEDEVVEPIEEFSKELIRYSNADYGHVRPKTIWMGKANEIEKRLARVLDHPYVREKFLPVIQRHAGNSYDNPRDFVDILWDAIDDSFTDKPTINLMRSHIRAYIRAFTSYPPTIVKAERYLATKFFFAAKQK